SVGTAASAGRSVPPRVRAASADARGAPGDRNGQGARPPEERRLPKMLESVLSLLPPCRRPPHRQDPATEHGRRNSCSDNDAVAQRRLSDPPDGGAPLVPHQVADEAAAEP